MSLLASRHVLHRAGLGWQNPYVESFGSLIPDELLSRDLFETLGSAQVLIEDWRTEYNSTAPLGACHDGAGPLVAGWRRSDQEIN